MKMYLLSLGAGLLVGVTYSLLNIRSPAPPLVALVGLLGMLAGEQLIPMAKHIASGHSISVSWRKAGCGAHFFGQLPGQAGMPERTNVNNVSEASP